ncbi:MAG: glycine oxidase, partial [Nitrospinae bacterium CG11_big_fil_rev_8_21_14_0_20_56_8]
MNTIYDIVIIGTGVIGRSIAFRLKRRRPELKIALLGDPMNSLMASRAAAGMLAPFGECTAADRFYEFCRGSLEKYPGFIRELVEVSGREVYLSLAGSLMPSCLYHGNWEERKQFLKDNSIPHELWPPEVVRKKAPHLAPDCGEVVWVAEGQVNNRQMHDALAAASATMRLSLLEKNVPGIIKEGARLRAAVTDSGEVRGDTFVLAAGSWSTQLGKILDVSIPLKP